MHCQMLILCHILYWCMGCVCITQVQGRSHHGGGQARTVISIRPTFSFPAVTSKKTTGFDMVTR